MKTSRLNGEMRWLAVSMTAVGLMAFATVAWAEQPNPEQVREQMRKLEHKAQELKAAGKEDQAHAVLREMQELREKFAHVAKKREGEQPGGDERRAAFQKKMEHLRAELKEAREGGQEERVAELQRGLHKLEEEAVRLKQQPGRERGAMPQPEQVREQMRKLEQKAKELQAAGKEDQANAVRHEMQALREKFAGIEKEQRAKKEGGDERRAVLQEKMEHLRAELKEAREAGQAERVAELQRALHKLEEEGAQLKQRPDRERGPQPHPEQAVVEQRLQHLREAVGHLKAAGLHEPAEGLAQEAEHMQQQMRGQPREQQGGVEVTRLQAELQELRQMVRKLNARLDEQHRDKR